jgi:sarcosine oxidase
MCWSKSANTEVLGWSAEGDSVRVQTTAGEFAASALVIAAGSWASELLSDLQLGLTVQRRSQFWFATDLPCYDVDQSFPVFLFELPHGVFYGFPKIDDRGVKVAEHTGGQAVDDPLRVNREMDPAEEQAVRDFLAAHLPAVSTRLTDHTVCLYTMSPDEHFLVDRHPAHPNVVFAAGLSGHGFKFAPVLGQALSELALDGATDLPIGFLALARLG